MASVVYTLSRHQLVLGHGQNQIRTVLAAVSLPSGQ